MKLPGMTVQRRKNLAHFQKLFAGDKRFIIQRENGKSSAFSFTIVLNPEAELSRPKIMVGTYGSDAIAKSAMELAKSRGAMLVACFIRSVNLSYKYDERSFTLDTDLAAQRTFARFLELGHDAGVPIMPVYDTGPDPAELLAENGRLIYSPEWRLYAPVSESNTTTRRLP